MKKSIGELRNALSPDTYGGIYLDKDQRKVHVNTLDTTNLDLLQEYDDVIAHKVKYSLTELNCIKEKLAQNMSELNIQAIGVDEKNNVVHIEIYEPTQDLMARIRAIAEKDDCLEFEEIFEKFTLQNCNYMEKRFDDIKRSDDRIEMSPGSSIYVENRGSCTITANVRWGNGESRKYGFLTCGHGIYAGDNVYYNNQYIGKVEQSTCDSEHDCGIIEQASPYIYVNGPARNGISFSYVGGNVSKDETVWFSGGTSASLTGICLRSSMSTTISGMRMEGLIETNCPTQPGDSGGMLFVKSDDNVNFTFAATLVGGNATDRSFFMPYLTTCSYYIDMYGYFAV